VLCTRRSFHQRPWRCLNCRLSLCFPALSLHSGFSAANSINEAESALLHVTPGYRKRQAKLDAEPGVVCFSGQGDECELAVGAPYLAASAGKVYFEVVSDGDEGCKTGAINVGLAGTNFRGAVVSRCEASWSIYRNFVAYHRSGKAPAYPRRKIDAWPGVTLAEAKEGVSGWRAAGSRRARLGRWEWRWTLTQGPCVSPSMAANGPSPSPGPTPAMNPTAASRPRQSARLSSPHSAGMAMRVCGATSEQTRGGRSRTVRRLGNTSRLLRSYSRVPSFSHTDCTSPSPSPPPYPPLHPLTALHYLLPNYGP
jgi:hypothetical protein